jgi:hypothetical protein
MRHGLVGGWLALQSPANRPSNPRTARPAGKHLPLAPSVAPVADGGDDDGLAASMPVRQVEARLSIVGTGPAAAGVRPRCRLVPRFPMADVVAMNITIKHCGS